MEDKLENNLENNLEVILDWLEEWRENMELCRLVLCQDLVQIKMRGSAS